MSTQENKQVVRRFFERLNQHDLSVMDDLFHTDARVHFPGLPGPADLQMIKPVWGTFFASFPDIRHEIQEIFAEEDKVSVRMIIGGRQAGEFQGLPPSNKQVSMSSINIFRLANGKISEQWVEYDAMGMLQQLGLIPQR